VTVSQQLRRIGLFIATIALAVTSTAIAQTKITKPSAGLPYKINSSGSYFLAANLAVTTKTNTAILVKANNVTINLNGFSISGLGAGSSGVGINASAATAIVIANGTITGYGTGITLGSNSTVEGVQILGNVADGIDVSGSSCFVSNSVVSGNGGIGLDFADSTSGYLNNVLNGNTTNVLGGFNMGGNVCGGSTC
jgi:hypothetical protein